MEFSMITLILQQNIVEGIVTLMMSIGTSDTFSHSMLVVEMEEMVDMEELVEQQDFSLFQEIQEFLQPTTDWSLLEDPLVLQPPELQVLTLTGHILVGTGIGRMQVAMDLEDCLVVLPTTMLGVDTLKLQKQMPTAQDSLEVLELQEQIGNLKLWLHYK